MIFAWKNIWGKGQMSKTDIELKNKKDQMAAKSI